jgi:hypothetical protein
MQPIGKSICLYHSPVPNGLQVRFVGSTPPSTGLRLDSACSFCGYRPYIPPSFSPLMSELLANDASGQYLDLFQTLGILTDIHLRIVIGMATDDRDRFFEAYVPRRLSQFAYLALTQMLQKFADQHRWAALTLVLISRKGKTFENFLSRADQPVKLVAQSMRLSEMEYETLAVSYPRQIPHNDADFHAAGANPTTSPMVPRHPPFFRGAEANAGAGLRGSGMASASRR